AVTAKIANTSAVPAIAVASGWTITRCRAPRKVPFRTWGRSDINSAVLPGELLDHPDVVLGHEAGARADVARSVHRNQAVRVEPGLRLRARLERSHHLRQIVRALLLHDREHADRHAALGRRLLVDHRRAERVRYA